MKNQECATFLGGLQKTKSLVLSFAVAALLSIGIFSTSAFAFPGFLEGPITDVDLAARTVRINGVLASVPPGTPISSPTASGLTLEDISLAVGGPLDGRPTGFENGTCLCATEVDELTGDVTVTDFVAEPAENVLIATVTEHSCSTPDCSGAGDIIRIGGTEMAINNNPRIPSEPPSDAGILINLQNLNGGPSPSLVGSQAAGEGYFGEDGKLHYYVLEVAGGVPLNQVTANVSITRARCRGRDGGAEYRVQGSTSNPPTGGLVTVTDAEGLVGTATPVLNVDNPDLGDWNFRVTLPGRDCQDTVSADYLNAETAEAGVDIR